MERRRAKRRPRRVQVRVSAADGGQHLGFTTNISQTGMFVAMNHVHTPGSRVRVEVLDRDRSIVLEAVVARALQVPAMFRGLEHQGIGLRFLRPDELMGDLLQDGTRPVGSAPPMEAHPIDALAAGTPQFEVGPVCSEPHTVKAEPDFGAWAAAIPPDAPTPAAKASFPDPWASTAPSVGQGTAGRGADGFAPRRRSHSAPQGSAPPANGSTPPLRPSAPKPALRGTSPAADSGTAASAPPHRVGPAARALSRSPKEEPARGQSAPIGYAQPLADGGSMAFVVSFATRDELRTRLAAEIQYGGIFVRHSDPPRVGVSVRVQIAVMEPPCAEVLEAKVIHRSDGSVSLAGFAVEFGDSMGVVSKIRKMLK